MKQVREGADSTRAKGADSTRETDTNSTRAARNVAGCTRFDPRVPAEGGHAFETEGGVFLLSLLLTKGSGQGKSSSPGKKIRSPGRASLLGVGGVLGEEEEYYEDDFDDDFEEEQDEDAGDEDEDDLYADGQVTVDGVRDSGLGVAAQSRVGQGAGAPRVGAQRPVSAKCSDALDFQRRQQGLEDEDIVEEAVGLESGEKDVDDDGFIRDEIAEEGEEDGDDDQAFEAAARSAQVLCVYVRARARAREEYACGLGEGTRAS